MANMVQLKGLARLRDSVLRQRQRCLRQLTVGLKRAGLLLQRESQKIVPVDTGNLRESAFTRARFENTPAIEVRVGYTAAYALYVHENLDALHGAAFNAAYADRIARAGTRRKTRKKRGLKGIHNPFDHSRGEDQQAKFLERPAREKMKEMRQIVRDALVTK